MTRKTCDRLWQAEALEDGRLEPKDRASFERHAETCSACRAELAELRNLQQQMAALPELERTDLQLRRARIALLGAAEQRIFGRRTAWSHGARWVGFALIPTVLAAVFLLWRGQHHAGSAPGFQVQSIAHASYSTEQSGALSRVVLRDGVAAFHVEHVGASARFLVQLPDGEVEVRGTRFVIDVEGGKTRSVSVSEGVVALRLAGTERLLRRGEAWRAPLAAPTVSASQALMPATPAASGEAASRPVPARSGGLGLALSAASSLTSAHSTSASPPRPSSAASSPVASVSSPVTSVSSAVPLAGEHFAEAMAAFSAGDYGRAERLLTAFARDFPADTRVEDAAFLRADARARRGDLNGAAAAARAYLKSYPNGLRRPDAERLVGLAESTR